MATPSGSSISSAERAGERTAPGLRTPTAWALLIPPAGLAVIVIVLLGGWAVGWQPLWPGDDYSLAEAVYLRDRAGALTRVRQGASLAERYPVRAGLVRAVTVSLTPLEAAVATRETYMVAWILELAPPLSDDERRGLVCFAREMAAESVIDLLSNGLERPDCSTVPRPWDSTSS